MKLKILGFGIAKEIFGGPFVELELAKNSDVASLRTRLEERFPKLKELSSYLIALNNEFSLPGDIINAPDEIAIIPPVSGG
jgi:molybdopterin converting factor small subunit